MSALTDWCLEYTSVRNWGIDPGPFTTSPMWFQTMIVYQLQFRAENMLLFGSPPRCSPAYFGTTQHSHKTDFHIFTEVIQINYTDLQLRLHNLLISSTTWGYIKSRIFKGQVALNALFLLNLLFTSVIWTVRSSFYWSSEAEWTPWSSELMTFLVFLLYPLTHCHLLLKHSN